MPEPVDSPETPKAMMEASPRLEELLERARNHVMTDEEIKAQRESSVRAEMGFGSDADEAAYAAAVLSGDNERVAELEEEAQARMDAFDKLKDEFHAAQVKTAKTELRYVPPVHGIQSDEPEYTINGIEFYPIPDYTTTDTPKGEIKMFRTVVGHWWKTRHPFGTKYSCSPIIEDISLRNILSRALAEVERKSADGASRRKVLSAFAKWKKEYQLK